MQSLVMFWGNRATHSDVNFQSLPPCLEVFWAEAHVEVAEVIGDDVGDRRWNIKEFHHKVDELI